MITLRSVLIFKIPNWIIVSGSSDSRQSINISVYKYFIHFLRILLVFQLYSIQTNVFSFLIFHLSPYEFILHTSFGFYYSITYLQYNLIVDTELAFFLLFQTKLFQTFLRIIKNSNSYSLDVKITEN